MSENADFYSVQGVPARFSEAAPFQGFEENVLEDEDSDAWAMDRWMRGQDEPVESGPPHIEIDENAQDLPPEGESSGEEEADAEPEELVQAREALEQARATREEAERVLEQARRRAELLTAEAEATLEQARGDAEQAIEEARRKTEEIEAQAYQAGFEQGEESGRKFQEQKMMSVIRNLEAVVRSARESRENWQQQCEEELVRLLRLVARKTIQRELRQDPSVVLDIVRRAIRLVQESSRIVLYVSPQDFGFIEEHLDQFHALVEDNARLNLEIDENISRGGCRLVSDTGEVDATLDTMFRNLDEEILGREEGGGV